MQKDYTKMPKRVSSIATEIESKRVLQSEQIRNADMANAYLVYYLSGGNEELRLNATPKDKVRPEDQDLRGWFAEMYGDKYIQILTSDLECSKGNPERVNQIVTDFNANPYGYILRTGAVNDYHIGRIVTCAKDVNIARKEAKKYSKELAILCAKMLLGGEAPNNNIFSIMHSSIRTWYRMQGEDSPIDFEKHIGSSLLTSINKQYNHTTYLAQVIFALFDMHTYSLPKDSWHVTSNTEVTTAMIETALAEIDGAGAGTMTALSRRVNQKMSQANALKKQRDDAVANGWDTVPLMTNELKSHLLYTVNDSLSASMNSTNPTPQYETLVSESEKVIGAEISRGIPYLIPGSNRFLKSSSPANTDSLFTNYDAYTNLEAQISKLQFEAMQDRLDTESKLEGGQTASDYHRVRAIELYAAFPSETEGVVLDYRQNWIKYVYQQVKQAYGLNYDTIAYYTGKVNGVNVYSHFPALIIPATYGQGVTNYTVPNRLNTYMGSVDISKSILLYAKALSGVTPAAYWSVNLSHRLVLKEYQATRVIPAHTKVFLYSANMKTGGISSERYTLFAEVLGDKDAAAASVGPYLPDVPLYKPGTNTQLTKVLNNSFSQQVSSDPTLQQWINSPSKGQFQYAYVIKSEWDPTYKLGNFITKASPTYLLGTKPGKYWLALSSTNPAVYNSHMDWLRATSYANQQYKGVTTFGPTPETLRYDPSGVKQTVPEFYEARNAITTTTMSCVAFPKSAISKIVAFMETVPSQIQNLLNQVNNIPNSPNYELGDSLSPNSVYGNRSALEAAWPEYRYGNTGDFDTSKFLNELDKMRTFLLNRTESLFIDDIAAATTKAYNNLIKNKPRNATLLEMTKTYDVTTFGSFYQDYMALLGAISYLNSYELLTDTPSHRNYAVWARPFKGRVDAIVNSLVASSSPQRIYNTQINDTEDVSNLHQTLNALGAFEDMTEMPVFDIQEFNITWSKLGPQATSASSTPFSSTGIIEVPVGGLKASAYRGLKNGYGDVFHDTIMNTCVMRPLLKHSLVTGFLSSSLRVPVNTRGISSKVYGMRPGSVSAFTTGVNSIPGQMRLTGSGGLTYTGLAGMAGVAFAGALGVAMFKNIASETAFSDKRFRIDDID